jgi:hypothetical protein
MFSIPKPPTGVNEEMSTVDTPSYTYIDNVTLHGTCVYSRYSNSQRSQLYRLTDFTVTGTYVHGGETFSYRSEPSETAQMMIRNMVPPATSHEHIIYAEGSLDLAIRDDPTFYGESIFLRWDGVNVTWPTTLVTSQSNFAATQGRVDVQVSDASKSGEDAVPDEHRNYRAA